MSSPIPVISPIEPAPAYEYAGFWRRFGAFWLDAVIVALASGIVHTVLSSTVSPATANAQDWHMQNWGLDNDATYEKANHASLLLWWLYYAICESSPLQATFGKKAFGMIVTDIYGKRLSFWRASGRFFGMFVSGALMLSGFIMIGFTARRQGLHDLFVDALVLYRRPPEPPHIILPP